MFKSFHFKTMRELMSSIYKLWRFYLLIIIMFILGCVSEPGDASVPTTSSSENSPTDSEGAGGSETTGSNSPLSELSGSWKGKCVDVDEDQERLNYFKTTFDVSGENGTMTFDHYGDEDCATDSTFSRVYKYTLEVGETAETEDGDEVNKIDLTVISIRFTPNTQETADGFNYPGVFGLFAVVKFCGYDNWEPGQSKGVEGNQCDGWGIIPDEDDVVYDIFRIAGGKTLYFGEKLTNDNQEILSAYDEDDRPNELDIKNKLSKVSSSTSTETDEETESDATLRTCGKTLSGK